MRLRIAVLTRREAPLSALVYRENLLARLRELDVEPVPFAEEGPPPADCPLVFDPGLGMGRVPAVLTRTGRVVVATVHGLRAFSLPAHEITRGVTERARLRVAMLRRRREWRRFAPCASRLIAVSKFGADELARAFEVPRERIRAVYYGVDHGTFRPEGPARAGARPYLLHVSSYQHKKNLPRILAAHAALPASERPDLELVVPGYRGPDPATPGVRMRREPLTAAELAPWYRGALAFVFPSLHETFGMPILEAMACGCPVLTAATTGCAEVAAEAALLVDPRSVDAIAGGLRQLARDPGLRARLREKGLCRAELFTWRACAEQHRTVFDEALAAAGAAASGGPA